MNKRLIQLTFESDCNIERKKILFRFKDKEFIIIPGTQEYQEVICYLSSGYTGRLYYEVYNTILLFFSCISYSRKAKIIISNAVSFNAKGELKDQKRRLSVRRKIKQGKQVLKLETYLPNVINEKQARALACYREGISSLSVFMNFFNFWKILEICVGQNKIVKWVNGNMKNNSIEYIRNLGIQNYGEWFKEECRNCIAHITKPPLISADNIKDISKILSATYAIKILAEYAIIANLNLKQNLYLYKIPGVEIQEYLTEHQYLERIKNIS